jgi:hypothetical protein
VTRRNHTTEIAEKPHLHHVPDVGVKEEVCAALAAAGCALNHKVVGRVDEPAACMQKEEMQNNMPTTAELRTKVH